MPPRLLPVVPTTIAARQQDFYIALTQQVTTLSLVMHPIHWGRCNRRDLATSSTNEWRMDFRHARLFPAYADI